MQNNTFIMNKKLTPEQVASLQSFAPPVGKHWFFCGCGKSFEYDSWKELEKGRNKHWREECINYERILRESKL